MTSTDPVVRHGIARVEHTLEVPIDRAAPHGPSTHVFAREVWTAGADRATLPVLLFLQGGPGGLAPRPRLADGWLGAALERHRVVLLDQRGTGRSDPIDVAAPWTDAAGRPLDDDALAARLAHYRADAIVADAEDLRRALLGEDGRWTLLGQSYGGFVACTYLSNRPDALEGVLIAGGVPSLDRPPIDVYRATYRTLIGKLRAHERRYPGDLARWRALAAHVAEVEAAVGSGAARGAALPPRGGDGRRATPLHVAYLGNLLGSSSGPDVLHEGLELALVGEEAQAALSTRGRRALADAQPFGASPIYAALHEAIYAQGAATEWAAARAHAEVATAWPTELPVAHAEMVLPEIFGEVAELHPLAGAAERLARRSDWPALYDPATLERNRVPVAAVAYADDLYVPLAFSQETAARVPNLRLWVTNEFEHDGLRAHGAQVFARLQELRVG
jgi:pimeloyl-ACP methyl ester carboxylesterase